MKHSFIRFVPTVLFMAIVAVDALYAVPAIFDDAVASWSMQSTHDSAKADNFLRSPQQGAEFGLALTGVDKAASLAAGGDGYAVRLNHASLQVEEAPDNELELASDQLTVYLRLKNATENWDLTLMGKHGGHDQLQYNLYSFDLPGDVGAELGFEFYTTDGYHGQRVKVPEATSDHWHTIVGRYDGESLSIFFDGRRVTSAPAKGSLRPDKDQPLIIGGEETSDGAIIRQFTGLIDHAAVWNRALSDEEIATLSGAETPALYTEPLRPQFHFSPRTNWINDPNGLLYANGQYHLFYQYNPFGDRWGHMSWGHAVSPDLLHWQHLPVALAEENGEMIWSGSAVHDKDNTSGLGKNGRGPLVAVYTARAEGPPERQTQAIAYSNDQGVTWTKYEGNPVIDRDTDAFRDPKVFWYEPEGKWVMVVSLPKEFKVLFYESHDLKRWHLLSEFGPQGVLDSGLWECPELIEMPLDGDPKKTRWVLQISIGKTPSGGTGGMYFVGHFDGKKFVNQNPTDLPLWVDYGRDFYALQAYNGIPDTQRRMIWLGWANNWAYANDIPTSPWRGAMTVPREIGLVTAPDGIRLVQQPIRELESLRENPTTLLGQTVTADRDPLTPLAVHGKSLDIVATFKPGSARRFGLRVLQGDEEYTSVGYDVRLDEMFVNRRHSGDASFTRDFGDHQWAPLLPDQSGFITLRILVDHSIVEVFGNDGQAVITSQVFPSPNSDGVSLFTDGGEVTLQSLQIYPLKSVWRPDSEELDNTQEDQQ